MMDYLPNRYILYYITHANVQKKNYSKKQDIKTHG